MFTSSKNVRSNSNGTELHISIENTVASHAYRVRRIRCDNDGENMSSELLAQFCKLGFDFKPPTAYRASTNGLNERWVQKHWTRERVMILRSTLPSNLSSEAIYVENLLTNPLSLNGISGETPIQ